MFLDLFALACVVVFLSPLSCHLNPPPFSVKVSVAASKAGAASKSIPLWKHYAEIVGNLVPHTLPVPCFNVINGGEHAGNALAFQEFFVILTGAETFT